MRTPTRRNPIRSTRPSRPFGPGIAPRELEPPPPVEFPFEDAPFEPSDEDKRFVLEMEAVANTPLPPATFADAIAAEAAAYRRRGDAFACFIADELEEVAMLAVYNDAASPAEHRARKAHTEDQARDAWEARGFDSGYSCAMAKARPFDGAID